MLDSAGEARLGKLQIGTTRRGIGPCYADKAARLGIRVQDLLDEKILKKKILLAMEPKRQSLRPYAKAPELDLQSMTDAYLTYGHRIEQYITDTARLTWDVLDGGGDVLFEGAQATMLDVDHGTYPYVTSSNPVSGGVCTGAGVGPTRIDRVIGVIKAYTTRVGSGPFPTELDDADGDRLREVGAEYGVTTGRPRRCGWYDAVIARYAARVNGLTEFFLTKLDTLGDWERIPVCVGYDIDGVRHDEMPMTQSEFHHATPVYELFDGWQEDISGCRSFEDLPKNAQTYVRALEEVSGAPFWGVGVGPGREQSITLREG
jgi:adenylosuccinate synthase